jgi:hypothetical protein
MNIKTHALAIYSVIAVGLRLVLYIPLLAVSFIACVLMLIGKAGEIMDEWADDMRYAIGTAISPQVWKALIDYKHRAEKAEEALRMLKWEEPAAQSESAGEGGK